MKKCKRLLSLLSAFMLLFALCGCEKEKEPQGDPKDYHAALIDRTGKEGMLSAYYIYTWEGLENPGSSDPYIHAGDSTLLISPDGKTMLIDNSNYNCGDNVADFLREMGVKTIDYLVCSHPHADHVGGFRNILAEFEVKAAYMNGDETTGSNNRNLRKDLAAKGVPITTLWEGDTFDFGSSIRVEVMNPPKDYAFSDDVEQANNGSVVMKLTYGTSTFLFSGDLYAKQERTLVTKLGDWLDVDVCKINHHGFATSSTDEWIAAVDAKIAVGMCEYIPTPLVPYKFNKSGAIAFHTAMDGTVAVHTPGDGTYQIQTEHLRELEGHGEYAGVNGYLELK